MTYRDAAKIFEKARKIAEQHGFISIESRVCTGLGELSWRGFGGLEALTRNGIHCCRHQPVLNYEAILLLRNAVVAGSLAEVNTTKLQANAFYNLAHVLFKCNDECMCPMCPGVPVFQYLQVACLVRSLDREQA